MAYIAEKSKFQLEVTLDGTVALVAIRRDEDLYWYKSSNSLEGSLRRDAQGNWMQFSGNFIGKANVAAIGQFIDQLERPETRFGFNLSYGGGPVYCEVISIDQAYRILFNSEFVAEIEMASDFNWYVRNGEPLPRETLAEIGWHIDCRHD